MTRHSCRTAAAVILLGCAAASCGSPQGTGVELARFPVDALPVPPGEYPPGVAVTFEQDGSKDGNGALKITYSGGDPVSVSLFEVKDPGNGCELNYSAALRTDDMKGVAYLELWCLVGEGRFFSRALQDTFTGTTDWRTTSTPFFLQPTDPRPDRVLLGVRMEGPGSVWLDDVKLTRGPLDKRWVVVRGDLVGGTFGLLAGAFGILAGTLAPRGRARLLVLGLGAAMFVGSVCLAATAAALLIAGHPSGAWMALGLPGAIGTVLFAALLPVIHRHYRDAELRRLAAMDLARSESS